MKIILKTINRAFVFILIVSSLIMTTAIICTFIDLYNNSSLVCLSKGSVEYFLQSFAWCKSIIGSVFAMFTVFYAFQTFKVHNENRLFNNYIAPKGEKINKNLKTIETKNRQLHNFISRNHREIIKKIICEEEDNNCSINNRGKLIVYFDKYITKQIDKFEHSGYYGINCKGNCSTCTNCNTEPMYSTSQFENFKLFAFDLFCISVEYSNFEEDIKEIYKKNIQT
jgi:hypothetical protein